MKTLPYRSNGVEACVGPQRPSAADARYYLRWYASATSCVLELFGYEELAVDIIPWLEQPASAHFNTCIDSLILASGAQCMPKSRDEQADDGYSISS